MKDRRENILSDLYIINESVKNLNVKIIDLNPKSTIDFINKI